MEKLEFGLEEELALMGKYGITPNEMTLLRTLLLLQDEDDEKPFRSCVEVLKSRGVSLRDVFSDLRDRGMILKSWDMPGAGERFDPYGIPVNKAFTRAMYRSSFDMGKELFEAYPQFGSVDGNVVPLRGVARHFGSLEDCFMKYGKAIKWNGEVHAMVLGLVEWGKERNVINQALSSFVINHAWLDLEAMRDGDGANVNYDTVRSL